MPTEHSTIGKADSHAPADHAAEHTDGTDDIQSATGAQKGLATAAQITKLNGIATGATDDTTVNAHIADTTDAHDASAVSFVPAGTVAATNVQAAIEEVASEGGGGGWTAVDASETVKGIAELATQAETNTGTDDTRIVTPLKLKTNLDLHVADSSDAHDASAISVADAATQYTSTNVEDALAEVLDALQAHEADSSDAHDASAISFSPTGSVAATDVQAAIAEVASEASGGTNYRTLYEVSSDVSNATTNFADITGLSLSVVNGTVYRFYALIVYTNSGPTVGASFSYNGPAATFQSHKAVWGGTTNASQTVTDAQGYDLNNVSTAHGAQGIYIATIEGIVKPSASGTLAMRFKSDGDGTIVVKAGSTLEVF